MEKDSVEKAIMEMKQELQRVRVLLESLTFSDDDDELELQITDSAIHTLRALKELKVKQSDGGLKSLENLGIRKPPQEFLCPISGLLMMDPIFTDFKMTYDNESLLRLGQKYTLANHVLKEEILKWCEKSQVPFIHEKGLENMTVVGLKRELQRVTRAADEGDDVLERANADAVETLCGLREIRTEQEPPLEFLCPISGTVMDNPVVIASGQTYELRNIKSWLEEGKRICPKTNKHLPHTLFIPNLLIREMISKWSVSSPFGSTARLFHLLPEFPSLYYIHQKAMLREIRLLTGRYPSFRALLTGTFPLLAPSMIPKYRSDEEMYKDVLVTILNISNDSSTKGRIVQECPRVISFLIESLGDQNSVENRGLAAASLCELSAIHGNKNRILIGQSGGVVPLLELLELGHPLASREAAGAVLSLCLWEENKIRALLEGGVVVFIKKLDCPELLSVLLEILPLFVGQQMAAEVMEWRGVVPRLFRVIEETRSGRDVENCLLVIGFISINSKTWISKIENVENAMKILIHVAKNGSVKATRMAIKILLRMRGGELPSVY